MPGPSTLTVWLYDSAMGAAAAEVRLKDLQQQNAITVHDALTVTWVPGAHEPRIGHLRHATTSAASKGSVLGALVGALFLSPVLGAAAGAGVGALAQRLRGTGIERDFLEQITQRLHPGTSALIVLSSDADLDIVRPFVERGRARGDVTLLLADLADDAPAALVDLLGDVGEQTSPFPGDADDPPPS
ncbi:DUF1269 domain-containing protein [Nocardioides sp. CER19]|uniref:DUF1269 domain-containing protein n=1 Tax=Nocardioides sp. CER19 TaxID=3038538 RepID=UPI00244BADC3|nr:DUF1269 domain-containing protein [Nocardioides sp. CER19]MDH2416007.1 DUF1269 domain-containing protein [Nocardioides sp. CER19]